MKKEYNNIKPAIPKKWYETFGIPIWRIMLYPICIIIGHRDVLCGKATIPPNGGVGQGLLCKRCGRVKWQ